MRRAPRVLVPAACWAQIERELSRVAPREGFAAPLVALRPRSATRLPGLSLRLRDLDEIVIGAVVCVPAHLQRNERVRVSALAFADDAIRPELAALAARHPRLRSCAFLHSHPFAHGSTSPSYEDLTGHLRPLLERNRGAGLAASLSFIACRSGREPEGWALQAFALDEDGRQRDLGFAQVIADDSAPARWALAGAWEESSAQKVATRWMDAATSLAPRLDELFDGWLRIRVDASPRASLLVLVPREFPDATPRLVAWDRPQGRTFELGFAEPGFFRADFLARATRRLQEVLPWQGTTLPV